MGCGRGEQVMMTNVFFVCPGCHRCFDILDVNGDGGVNFREFLKVPVFNSMSGHFYKLDTDKSGELDREEFIRGTLKYFSAIVFISARRLCELFLPDQVSKRFRVQIGSWTNWRCGVSRSMEKM